MVVARAAGTVTCFLAAYRTDNLFAVCVDLERGGRREPGRDHRRRRAVGPVTQLHAGVEKRRTRSRPARLNNVNASPRHGKGSHEQQREEHDATTATPKTGGKARRLPQLANQQIARKVIPSEREQVRTADAAACSTVDEHLPADQKAADAHP
jgi:hypothetical protein